MTALPLLVPAPPRVAHKRARLVDAGGRVVFAALSAPVCYGTHGAASCPWCHHEAPSPECTCGFWGVEDPWLLDDVVGPRRRGESFLVVELSGSSVAYELGARAGRQRVLAVGVDGWCSECLALGRVTCATRLVRFAKDRGPFLWSVCLRHSRGALRTYTADDLALLLKMPVALDWSQAPDVDRPEQVLAASAHRAPVALTVVLLVLALVFGWLNLASAAALVGFGVAATVAMRSLLRHAALESLEHTPPRLLHTLASTGAIVVAQLVASVAVLAL
ncbi:MAG TPA: hypothetical protein VFZ83_01860 [Acidimicrobiia bacterium]|nr:hypothetical protein [Acidimicrobiia bacterium]